MHIAAVRKILTFIWISGSGWLEPTSYGAVAGHRASFTIVPTILNLLFNRQFRA
jgi:hypothetical protein